MYQVLFDHVRNILKEYLTKNTKYYFGSMLALPVASHRQPALIVICFVVALRSPQQLMYLCD